MPLQKLPLRNCFYVVLAPGGSLSGLLRLGSTQGACVVACVVPDAVVLLAAGGLCCAVACCARSCVR